MLRPIERSIFDLSRDYYAANPGEKFLLILDEAHLYRGAQGAEVAILIRRLRSRLGLTPERVLRSKIPKRPNHFLRPEWNDCPIIRFAHWTRPIRAHLPPERHPLGIFARLVNAAGNPFAVFRVSDVPDFVSQEDDHVQLAMSFVAENAKSIWLFFDFQNSIFGQVLCSIFPVVFSCLWLHFLLSSE